MDGTPDVTFAGEKQRDRFGISLAGAGDVDGDGYYEVLIGAYLADTGAGEDMVLRLICSWSYTDLRS